MRRFCCLGLVLPLFLIVPGCQKNSGPNLATVTGVVTVDGNPLPSGQIVFHDPQGQIGSSAGQILQGRYTTTCPPIVMRVEITDYRDVEGKFDESNPGAKVPLREQYLPARYNEQSELTADVKEGRNQLDFPLTLKK